MFMRIDVFQSGNPMFIALNLDTHRLRGSGNNFIGVILFCAGWKAKKLSAIYSFDIQTSMDIHFNILFLSNFIFVTCNRF